jgi:hypothetical protein
MPIAMIIAIPILSTMALAILLILATWYIIHSSNLLLDNGRFFEITHSRSENPFKIIENVFNEVNPSEKIN